MRICRRGIGFMQVFNAQGDVRGCSWMKECYLGNIIENDIPAIMHGEKAQEVRQTLLDGTYANCRMDNCPYLANGTIESQLVDIDEIPDYPEMLFLAYEGVCNYKCTCCTSHQHMEDTKVHDYSLAYDKLEEHLRAVLPYVKHIDAHGRGELFASRRILKLLSEWKPLAPINEITVGLETNGSLFDEKHWKQIENLGQYHLTVAVTVMSFDEMVYQHLSGTSLPVRQIEDNLRFIKSLREKGVINFLELATVLQEANFREMPEFARRCIEEFGADRVRIRPIFPGGEYDWNIQWFMDVRNPMHPYYEQYRKVMEHPIFRHPKVILWSGDYDSPLGEHPGIRLKKDYDKLIETENTVKFLLSQKDIIKEIKESLGTTKISLYGIGMFGKLFVQLAGDEMNIMKIYDRYACIGEYKGIPIVRPVAFEEKSMDEVIMITVYDGCEEIRDELQKNGFRGTIVNLHGYCGEHKACTT